MHYFDYLFCNIEVLKIIIIIIYDNILNFVVLTNLFSISKYIFLIQFI